MSYESSLDKSSCQFCGNYLYSLNGKQSYCRSIGKYLHETDGNERLYMLNKTQCPYYRNGEPDRK